MKIHLSLYHLLLTFALPLKVTIILWLGFIHSRSVSLSATLKEFIFPEALTLVHFQIRCHCQTDLSLLFSSQHSLFFPPLPHYLIQYFSSFSQISLKQHHYPSLRRQKGVVLFLRLPTEINITTWQSWQLVLSKNYSLKFDLEKRKAEDPSSTKSLPLPKHISILKSVLFPQ